MLITQFAGTRLRLELDRVPLWRGDHVTLKQLAEDFAQYLVKPDVAARQLQEDTGKRADGDGGETRKKRDEEEPKEHRPRRFYGSVRLDATRLGRDAGKIAEEVVQHLSGIVGAEVEVTLEIHAKVDAGVPDNVIRTVTENCKTLRFESHEFEES